MISSISSVIITCGESAFLVSTSDNLNKLKSKFNIFGGNNTNGNDHLIKAQEKKSNKENKKKNIKNKGVNSS